MTEPEPKSSNPRSKIPDHVKVPKFCSAKDVQHILDVKEAFPELLWHEVIADVIETLIEEDLG